MAAERLFHHARRIFYSYVPNKAWVLIAVSSAMTSTLVNATDDTLYVLWDLVDAKRDERNEGCKKFCVDGVNLLQRQRCCKGAKIYYL